MKFWRWCWDSNSKVQHTIDSSVTPYDFFFFQLGNLSSRVRFDMLIWRENLVWGISAIWCDFELIWWIIKFSPAMKETYQDPNQAKSFGGYKCFIKCCKRQSFGKEYSEMVEWCRFVYATQMDAKKVPNKSCDRLFQGSPAADRSRARLSHVVQVLF